MPLAPPLVVGTDLPQHLLDKVDVVPGGVEHPLHQLPARVLQVVSSPRRQEGEGGGAQGQGGVGADGCGGGVGAIAMLRPQQHGVQLSLQRVPGSPHLRPITEEGAVEHKKNQFKFEFGFFVYISLAT